MKTASVDISLLEAAIGKFPADSLSGLRREALAVFERSGFPTTRQEDWKYTNLAGAAEISNEWLDAVANGRTDLSGDQDRPADADIITAVDADWIVIRDGAIQMDLPAADGLELTRIAGSEPRLDPNAEPMAAFNLALLRDGLRVRTTPGTSPARPVGLLFVDRASNAVSQSRIVIEVTEGSTLQVVQADLSEGSGRQFSNSVVDVDISAGGNLDMVRIQSRDQAHTGVSRLAARLARDSSLHYSGFDLGGALTRNDIIAELAGPGASVTMDGLYLASGSQHVDNHTTITHGTGPSTSREEYRGILAGGARCVFNGRVVVAEGADGTDSSQSNHNLLLSDRAEIDTKPELEIYADDVKCAHGATVGQLDEAALFYLRSRGLDRDRARQVLTRAFAAGTLSNLAVDASHDYLAGAVEQRLEDLVGEPQ